MSAAAATCRRRLRAFLGRFLRLRYVDILQPRMLLALVVVLQTRGFFQSLPPYASLPFEQRTFSLSLLVTICFTETAVLLQ